MRTSVDTRAIVQDCLFKAIDQRYTTPYIDFSYVPVSWLPAVARRAEEIISLPPERLLEYGRVVTHSPGRQAARLAITRRIANPREASLYRNPIDVCEGVLNQPGIEAVTLAGSIGAVACLVDQYGNRSASAAASDLLPPGVQLDDQASQLAVLANVTTAEAYRALGGRRQIGHVA